MRNIVLSLAVACAAANAARAAAPPPPVACLALLVKQLGDDDFEIRREAARRLAGWPGAIPLLEEASVDDDAERRAAAVELLRPFEARRARAACRRMGVLLGEGRFDLLPDHAMRWGPVDPTEHCFQAASFIGNHCRCRALARAKGVARESMHDNLRGGGIPLYAWSDPARRGTGWRTMFIDAIDTKLSSHAQFVANSMRLRAGDGILICTGTLSFYDLGPSSAIAIANGDVAVNRGNSFCSIIICDGAVALPSAGSSIIIARKGIAITDMHSHGSVLASGGKVTMPAKERKNQFVQEDAKRPLGLVRFFEVSDVGLTLDGLSVKDARGALADAGLRKGDAFLSIDGVAVKDAEALRRALRKRYAIDGVGLFTLKRGDKTLTLRARLAD